MKKICFYTYVYRDGDEPIYVGKGHGRRAWVHLSRKDKHPFVNRLKRMRAEGKQPSIEIVEALDEGHALFLEECLIAVFGRKDRGAGTLLNMTDGGENPPDRTGLPGYWANKKVPVEVVEKRRRGIIKAWIGRPGSRTGTSQSAETKAKISQANKGITRRTGYKSPHEKIECPHCKLVGDKPAMSRWHFDRCKEI